MADPVNQEINVNINALVKRIQDVREFVALIRSLRESRGSGPVIIDEKISKEARASTTDVQQLNQSILTLAESVARLDDKQPTQFGQFIRTLSSIIQGLAAAGDAVDFVKNWIPGFEAVKEKGSEAFGTVSTKVTLFAATAASRGSQSFAALRAGGSALLSTLRGVAGGLTLAAGGVTLVTGGIAVLITLVAALAVGFTAVIGSVGALTTALVTLGTVALLPLLQFGAKYNAQIEQGKLGIASIIASLAEFRNEAGQPIKGPESLNAALQLADDQIKKLKVDAINTIATFGQILPAFQAAIGPGLSAGLQLDQVRQITVQIVQAAGAIGLPANQIAQEVRAILDGTIDINARLAKVLGITNEMVSSWKEQGTLAEELNKRLEAFSTAGEIAADTMDGLTSNLEEAVNVFAGQATEKAFERLKVRISAILKEIFDFKNAGLNKSFEEVASFIDDLFVRAIDIAGDFIDEVIQGAKDIAGWIQRNRSELEEILHTVGEIIRLIGYVILELARVAARLLGNKTTVDLLNNALSFTKGLVALIGATVLTLADAFAVVATYVATRLNPVLSTALAIAEKIARALNIRLPDDRPNVGVDAVTETDAGIFRKKVPDFTVRPPAPDAKKKGSASASKPVDTIESEFALRRTLAERDFNLEKDLLERLTEIYRTALDTRKVSTEEYFRALEGLRQRELVAEIKLNEKLLQIEKDRRDAELKKIAADKDSTPAQKTALRTNVENKFEDTTAQLEEKLTVLRRGLADLPREIEVAETAALRTLDDQITAFLAKVDEANGKTAEAAAKLIDLEFRELLEKITIEQGENSPLVQLIKEFIQLQKERARVKQIDEQLVPLGQEFETRRLEIERDVAKHVISQREGRREINELQRAYITAQIANLKNQLAETTEVQKQLELKRRIAELEKGLAEIVDQEAVAINASLRFAFEDFFASMADGTKSIKEAFADLGRFILQLFARLAAQRLVESLFGGLFGEKAGDGGLGGVLADLFGGKFGGKKAAGDMMSARPGGQLIQVAEAGYDELVVTTDPRYAKRTSGLLTEFIRRTGILPDVEPFAAGGFARRIANTFTTAIPRLAAGAFVSAAGPETALAGISTNAGPSEFLIKQFNIYDPSHVHDAMRHDGGDAVFWNFIDHNATEIRQRLKVRS